MPPEALLVPPGTSSSPPAPAAIEAALRESDPNATRLSIAGAFVLHHADANDFTVYALVSGGGLAFAAGAEICVNNWSVLLISADCPIGRAVSVPPAGLGDCVTVRLPGAAAFAAQIISWNGSPVLTDAERTDCRQMQAERERATQTVQAEQRKRAALRAKEDGTVANLRARRLAHKQAAQNG